MLRAVGVVGREEEEARKKLRAEGEEAPTDVEIEKAVSVSLKGRLNTFISLFGALPGSAPLDFQATPWQALFLLNGKEIHAWLKASSGMLIDRLSKMDDPAQLAEELYLSVLSRRPDPEEDKGVTAYLAAGDESVTRVSLIQELVWAFVSSVEFRFIR